MSLLAKSPERGKLTLEEHTRHVIRVATQMADAYKMPPELARQGALLHDLGKAHPAFQAMLHENLSDAERATLDYPTDLTTAIEAEMRDRRLKRAEPHRHEISSLALLPLFKEANWPALIEMVVGHHKSVEKDRSERGLLDLTDRIYGPDRVIERHIAPWEVWAPHARSVVAQFGVEVETVSQKDARDALAFVRTYVSDRPAGWSRWRGLLMAADRMASALQADVQRATPSLFRVPDLGAYDRGTPRTEDDVPLYPLAEVPASDPRPHTLVTAPTGGGKTDFLLRRCRGRVFYVLPFQASINAMYLRLRDDLAPTGADVRRLHGAARIPIAEEADDAAEDSRLQAFPGAAVKVLTPHQIASIIFGTREHEAVRLDLAGEDVILDEVHVYSEATRAMVVALVRALSELGCRVHVGTATIPTALAEVVVGALGGPEAVHRVRLSDEVLDSYVRHRVEKLEDEDAARDRVLTALDDGDRVLFIANRVARAQERFRWLHAARPDIPAMVLHSRYRRRDRADLEARIGEFEAGEGPCVVVATQVVEVSLDISFDCMVTDAAPLDALVQRFGRINRRRAAALAGPLRPVAVVAPPEEDGDILPYEADTVRASFEHLPDGEPLRDRDVEQWLDVIYPEVELTSIATHLVAREDRFTLRELRDKQANVLLEIMEGLSVACIRASDRNVYLDPPAGVDRQELEIPVSWRSLAAYRDDLSVLEWGNQPLILPDRAYNPGDLEIGLVLTPEHMQPFGSTAARTL